MASVAQRPNGRWRARYRDAHGVEHARHFPTKTAARRWLDEVTADQLAGRYVDPRAGRVLLADYYRRYAERQLWQPTTRRSMDHAVLTCPLVTQPVNAITPAQVEEWIKAMVDAGLAGSTVRTRVAALRAVLSAAVRDGLRHTNPVQGLRLPRTSSRARAVTLPSPRQVGLLIAAAESPTDLVVDLAAHAGLRVGEIRGLQVGDIDPVEETLTVRRQVRDLPGGGWQLAEPKYGSARAVPLPRHLTQHLRRHLPTLPVATAQAFLIPGHRGAPIAATTLARAWQAAKEQVEIPAGLRLHDLRHFYASACIAAGLDVVEVQHRLGHARPSTTLDVYAHRFRRSAHPARPSQGPHSADAALTPTKG